MSKKSNGKAKKSNGIVARAKQQLGAQRSPHFQFSPCAQYYNAALHDPWSLKPGLACVPDLRCLPTIKQCFVVRSAFYAGSAGVGWCLMSPMAPTATNSGSAQVITPGTYAGTISSTMTLADAGTDFQNYTPSPAYTLGTTNSAAEWRLVGMGLRCKYVGKLVDRAGTYYEVEAAGNDTLLANGTITSYMQNQRTRMKHIGDNFAKVTWFPQRSGETDFITTAFVGSASQVCPIGIIVVGAEEGAAFETEMVWHWEVSQPQSGFSTPSHSDTVGMGLVLAARTQASSERETPSLAGSLAKIGRAAAHSITGFVSTAAGAAGAAIGSMAGPMGAHFGGAMASAGMSYLTGSRSTAIVPYDRNRFNQD